MAEIMCGTKIQPDDLGVKGSQCVDISHGLSIKYSNIAPGGETLYNYYCV